MSESLSTDQRVALLESRVNHLEDALAQFLSGASGAKPEKLIASSPVMPDVFGAFGGDWFDATGFAALYNNNTAYHTGADLNLPAFKDSGRPVYAAADGVCRFAGTVSGWQGQVVVIEHVDGGALVWTRYAHIVIGNDFVCDGKPIKRGQALGYIADYNKDGPKGDHVHFDVGLVNLGEDPGNWPGLNLALLKRTYADPLQWLKDHKPS